jgi:hypothetical protein
MPEQIPLPTLLSHALVAMTIGLDNELEQRIPHRTTMGVKRGLPAEGPWLVSWATWANLLRFVPAEGIRLAELRQCPGVPDGALGGKNPGAVRWGYVVVEDGLVRPTPVLKRLAAEHYPHLPEAVEAKWSERLGGSAVEGLHAALGEVLAQVGGRLPRYIPEADEMMWTPAAATPGLADPLAELSLVDRLAQVLLLYAIEHERTSSAPLTMAANLLRVVDGEGTPTRDLVRRSGISKEALAFLTGWRQRPRLTESASPASTTLTPAGRAAKSEYEALPARIEAAWQQRFTPKVTAGLRAALEAVVVDTVLSRSPLGEVVAAPDGGWRSWVRAPETLPHFPMVLHRGGYPDGA